MEFILNTHRFIFIEAKKDSLDAIYGEWKGGWVCLPIGESGAVIFDRAKKKQTEAGKIECEKRGANA